MLFTGVKCRVSSNGILTNVYGHYDHFCRDEKTVNNFRMIFVDQSGAKWYELGHHKSQVEHCGVGLALVKQNGTWCQQ